MLRYLRTLFKIEIVFLMTVVKVNYYFSFFFYAYIMHKQEWNFNHTVFTLTVFGAS